MKTGREFTSYPKHNGHVHVVAIACMIHVANKHLILFFELKRYRGIRSQQAAIWDCHHNKLYYYANISYGVQTNIILTYS